MKPMIECMRWFGPNDRVTLAELRQCGCAGVYSALHDVPYGETWSREAIAERRAVIEAHGLAWTAVESVPVSEAIRTRTGDFRRHLANYGETLRHLGDAGVRLVVYNFMPVLDWVRTDMAWRLPDGRECLHFDPAKFAAFEIFLLRRPRAEEDYSADQLARAEAFFRGLSAEEARAFERTIIDVFPGCRLGLTLDDVRAMLAAYATIDRDRLTEHFAEFLAAVVPVAEAAGVRLAVHPDDPPFSILGLPRIVSTEDDLRTVLGLVDRPANGICLCTGSLGARGDNDLPGMVERLGERIHAVHLRSVQRCEDGCFFEADHLEGSSDVPAVVAALLAEQRRRLAGGREDWQLSFRPDHGHAMLDDLAKPPLPTPGYTCIGRMKGLAELRGLQRGLLLAAANDCGRRSRWRNS